MPTTSSLGLPYPSLTSAPNVPSDIQALANKLDTAAILPKRTRGTVSNQTTDATGYIQVTHGLGVTPAIILHTVNSTQTANDRALRTYARTSTTFTVQCYYNGSVAASNAGWGFDWVAEA